MGSVPENGRRVLAAVIAFNEEKKIGRVLGRFCDTPVAQTLLVDDGSTDQTARIAGEAGVTVISHAKRSGAGAAIRTAIEYGVRHGFDILVIAAGNDKDRPSEIPRLLTPILGEEADFVQGSRYLPGGETHRVPFYRQLATRYVHPWLFSLAVRRRLTDTTNGFRAFRLSIVKNPQIDLSQAWLDRYELEPYLLYKAITLGYRVREVPVTKIYPPKELGYTKMTPITGWWSILRPIFLLALGVKR